MALVLHYHFNSPHLFVSNKDLLPPIDWCKVKEDTTSPTWYYCFYFPDSTGIPSNISFVLGKSINHFRISPTVPVLCRFFSGEFDRRLPQFVQRRVWPLYEREIHPFCIVTSRCNGFRGTQLTIPHQFINKSLSFIFIFMFTLTLTLTLTWYLQGLRLMYQNMSSLSEMRKTQQLLLKQMSEIKSEMTSFNVW